ncbi:NUMOD3 domain-containing DNA-binding protein [Allopusillimonas ginsengisoli]|uniref:NUMOD3 domain-containing DNA-binding protein n=1 Tax=Allopusillimonas ginsengisoli TaxID=453575 RepID=UPI0039C35AE4
MDLYRISFLPELTEKVYIGISSKGARRRFSEHCCSKNNYPIVAALKKYGKENAILTVLGVFDDFDSLYAAEQEAISRYRSKAPRGFNLTDGGKGAFGLRASEERKLKIGNANRGRKLSEEHKAKISAANMGQDRSRQVDAMARANRGRKISESQIQSIKNTWTGRKHTDETKLKMSKSASKRKASDETRRKMSDGIRASKGSKVYVFLSPDGHVVEVRDMAKFCKEKDLCKSHMYSVASGKIGGHKGWARV